MKNNQNILETTTKEEYKQKNNIKTEEELFNNLLNNLKNEIKSIFQGTISENKHQIVIKTLNYLDETLEQIEHKKQINTKYLRKIKQDTITYLKETDKTKPKANKKIEIYQKIINRLENIELNINYNKNKETIDNYNIIKYVLIDLKDANISQKIVKEYGYLINAYNQTNPNIINQLVNEYIKELYNYMDIEINYDLCYYESIINAIFENKKIIIEEKTLKENTNKCLKILKHNKNIEEKKRIKMFYWINHLINMLNDKEYVPTIETINNLYNIRFYFKQALHEEGRIYYLTNLTKTPAYQEEYIISIDDEDNYNRDDAVSITKENENYNLKIYISDPNTFCTMDSLLIKEARKRSQSIYLSDRTIEIFPESIIENYLSLNEEKQRLARIYNYKISEDGQIIDFYIEKSPIIVNKNLSYEKVNNNKYEDKKINETIEQLHEIRNIITKNYNIKNQSNSETLIESLMVFNNINVARYFKQHNLPLIYRNFELKKIKHFEDIDPKDENTKKIIKIINSITNQAYFSDKVSHHDGVNEEYYCYSTSPNRRYADILVNECEDTLYFNKPTNKEYYAFEEYLKKEADYLNQKNLQIAEYYTRYARTLKR